MVLLGLTSAHCYRHISSYLVDLLDITLSRVSAPIVLSVFCRWLLIIKQQFFAYTKQMDALSQTHRRDPTELTAVCHATWANVR